MHLRSDRSEAGFLGFPWEAPVFCLGSDAEAARATLMGRHWGALVLARDKCKVCLITLFPTFGGRIALFVRRLRFRRWEARVAPGRDHCGGRATGLRPPRLSDREPRTGGEQGGLA